MNALLRSFKVRWKTKFYISRVGSKHKRIHLRINKPFIFFTRRIEGIAKFHANDTPKTHFISHNLQTVFQGSLRYVSRHCACYAPKIRTVKVHFLFTYLHLNVLVFFHWVFYAGCLRTFLNKQRITYPANVTQIEFRIVNRCMQATIDLTPNLFWSTKTFRGNLRPSGRPPARDGDNSAWINIIVFF